MDVGQVQVNLDARPRAALNFHLERVAVLPMDIRIEAVLYAQTRSFFVIPGAWFNTATASDTLDAFEANGGVTRPYGDDDRDPESLPVLRPAD